MKENVLKNSDEINFRVQDSSIRKSETNLETTDLKICLRDWDNYEAWIIAFSMGTIKKLFWSEFNNC